MLLAILCMVISTSISVVTSTSQPAEVIYHVLGLGDVQGTIVPTPVQNIDTNVHQFTGIPYAKPPVGDLRFTLPEPVKPWTPAVIDATKPSPSCMQEVGNNTEDFSGIHEDSSIQEDCLYLNIWVPKNAVEEIDLPVMFWIHGGSFMSGSVSDIAYTGDILAAVGNVVVVSTNYRLGAFGFAHIGGEGGEPVIPGNLGLLDQQLALRWVHDHIRIFGGDPDKITIFGESAGSGSVTAQVAAPGSADLFIRAIPQSGGMRDPWSHRSTYFLTNNTLKLAADLGCKEDKATALRCLRAADADAIVRNTAEFSFLPLDNDRHFFKGSVLDRLTSTDLSDKSIVLGTTADEYRIFMLSFFPMDAVWTLDRDGYAEIADHALSMISGKDAFDPLLRDALLWHYDNSTQFGTSYVDKMSQLGTDYIINCGHRLLINDWLRLKSNFRPKNVYLYLYNQTTPTRNGLGMAQMKAFHASDISPVFGEPLRRSLDIKDGDKTKASAKAGTSAIEMFDEDGLIKLYTISMKMINFWTNFAKFGNPNGAGSIADNETWVPATDPENLVFQVIQADDTYSRMIPDRSKDDCRFWQEVMETNAILQDA